MGPNYYLVTYTPLVARRAGREAVASLGLQPFVDSSCRREPDLESRYPSISALCRAGKFAPKLLPGDVVVYLARKGRYPGTTSPHRRLVAILEVRRRFTSHASAAKWYRSRKLQLPGNCMVRGNRPLPLEKTGRWWASLSHWDAEYQRRAGDWPDFLACDVIFRELRDPPIVTDTVLRGAFGRVPGTQNPPRVSRSEVLALVRMARIKAKLPKERSRTQRGATPRPLPRPPRKRPNTSCKPRRARGRCG
jgi:hypothetical protein